MSNDATEGRGPPALRDVLVETLQKRVRELNAALSAHKCGECGAVWLDGNALTSLDELAEPHRQKVRELEAEKALTVERLTKLDEKLARIEADAHRLEAERDRLGAFNIRLQAVGDCARCGVHGLHGVQHDICRQCEQIVALELEVERLTPLVADGGVLRSVLATFPRCSYPDCDEKARLLGRFGEHLCRKCATGHEGAYLAPWLRALEAIEAALAPAQAAPESAESAWRRLYPSEAAAAEDENNGEHDWCTYGQGCFVAGYRAALSASPTPAPLVCRNCGPRTDKQAPEWQCVDCGACVSAARPSPAGGADEEGS